MTWTHAGLWADSLAGRDGPYVSGSVSVYLAGTLTLATLYANRNKAGTVANPTTTDALGNLELWLEPGLYDLTTPVSVTPFITVTVPVDQADVAPGPVTGFVPTTAVPNQLYGTSGAGAQTTYGVAAASGAGTVALRTANQALQAATLPDSDPSAAAGDLTTRSYSAQFVQNFLGPQDHGAIAWNFIPYLQATGVILTTAGTVYLMRVPIRNLVPTVTNINMHLTALGSGLTVGQNFAALFSLAGNLLSSTADMTATWSGTTGVKTMPLITPQLNVSAPVFAAVFANGTTLPTFSCGASNNVARIDFNVSGFGLITATCANGVGRTTSMPATTGALSSTASNPWWVALT